MRYRAPVWEIQHSKSRSYIVSLESLADVLSAFTEMPTEIRAALIQALPATLLAIWAVRISKRQTAISRHAVNVELFQERWSVYSQIGNFVGSVFREGTVSERAYIELVTAKSRAHFLFGADVNDFLGELLARAKSVMYATLDLETYRQIIADEGSPAEGGKGRENAVARKWDDVRWIVRQAERLPEVFAPYLNMHFDE